MDGRSWLGARDERIELGNLRVTHAVDEWVGTVFGPQILVVEFPGVPHHLVHDLGKPDRVRRWTWAGRLKASATWVGNVRLVVRAIKVLPIPTSTSGFMSESNQKSHLGNTHVGNVMVARMPPPHILLGSENVSSPVQGAPPNGFCAMLLKQRWQSCFCCFSPARSMGSPTIIRKPYH